MKIQSYELYEVAIPTRRRHVWATSTVDVGSGYLLIKLISDDGTEGWGECTAMAEWGGDFGVYYGETRKTCRIIFEEFLFPAIEGCDPFEIAVIHDKMDKAVRGYPYAKTGVDMAVYDMLGKALDKPVCKLLGGQYRDRIELGHSLGINLSIEEAVEEAVMVQQTGFHMVKIKGGWDPARDLELLRRVRKEVGPEMHIIVDANQAYRSAKEAIQWGQRMDEYNLFFMEQPVEGLEQMAQVTDMLRVPVCADESCWTPTDALNLLKYKGADFFSIYVAKPGGLYKGRVIASIAEAAAICCNVNGSGEFGIGNAACMHLAASSKCINLPCMIPVTHVDGHPGQPPVYSFIDDIITKPFEYEDGCLLLPEGPGLGVEIDMDKIRKYSI
ncbi:MAG: hypothetical protein K1W34_11745 [Lachnospiraceae bacterium]